jgi:hypothetical protein
VTRLCSILGCHGLTTREPAAHLTLVLPAARRAFKRPIACALIADLAVADLADIAVAVTDNPVALANVPVANTVANLAVADLAVLDLAVTDPRPPRPTSSPLNVPVADLPSPSPTSPSPTSPSLANVPVANTVATRHLTSPIRLLVTLFAVLAAHHGGRHLAWPCAVVSDFEDQVGVPRGDARRLVAFLGGTIGNLLPAQRAPSSG